MRCASSRGTTATPLTSTDSVDKNPSSTSGRMLDIWQRPLVVGQALPAMTLMLSGNDHVSVNLDATYSRAAAGCYLE